MVAIGEDLRLQRQERATGVDEVDAGETVLPRDLELFKGHTRPGCELLVAYSSTETGAAAMMLLDHDTQLTGSRVPVDYGAPDGPVLAVRVQELFGLDTHPSIAAGRVPLILHLLSPAQRPIQITRDLPGFWRGSWASVKADMRGQYPKHPWPDDPLSAAPTRRTKPRGS